MNTREINPDPTRSWSVAVVIVCAIVAFVALVARAEPPNDASVVIRDAQGSLTDTDGWCEAISTTPENLWASKPARISTAEEGEIRFVEVANIDSSIVVCSLLGDSGDHASGATFACDGSANESGRIAAGSYRQYGVRRTKAVGAVTGDSPELWAVSASGTPTVCVTVGW